MKNKIFPAVVVGFFLSSCSCHENHKHFVEETRLDADSSACVVTVKNELILNDTAFVFPKIAADDSSVTTKINSFLTVQRLSYYTLEELEEYRESFKKDSILMGLTAANYEVTYNENCLLSITVNMETMGAYPSGYSVYRNFDVRTGDSICMSKILDETKINDLVKHCNTILQDRIVHREKIPADEDFNIDEMLKVSFTKENLSNFYVTTKEVVFVFDFGFPHAIQGTEPDGFIKIKREDFRKYLREQKYGL